ncbi:MAG: oxygen-dependent coproporphyrinogen oxidase [Bacteroidetes bacterium]|nr:oxygen-dependent coproporphyrinogen oxidase [Bacteroidota bacterium]
MHSITYISAQFQTLQDFICQKLEAADGIGKFQEDLWMRAAGGGGRTRTISGEKIEKGGVAFSAVHGPLPDTLVKSMQLEPGNFFATGVSIVLHPESPMAPIIHMNVRYFETSGGRWWFGGGIDLTPHYIVDADARDFHLALKSCCDQFHPDFYSKFKDQADSYFYLPHRKETRGVGGIFYDYLNDSCGLSQAELLNFCLALGRLFPDIYADLLQRAAQRPWGTPEKKWQMLRRGRYVEFNLVWDRGTRFGLETDGRTESILMSMPPGAEWIYNFQPDPEGPESKTLLALKPGIDWINA